MSVFFRTITDELLIWVPFVIVPISKSFNIGFFNWRPLIIFFLKKDSDLLTYSCAWYIKSVFLQILLKQTSSLSLVHQSSESKNAIQSPLASLMPRFLDLAITPSLEILKYFILKSSKPFTNL